MCGIIGYAGWRPAGELLFNGLRRLEYRGYDSAGVATIEGNGRIDLRKDAGKIDALNKRLHFEEMRGVVGIAHTRWATHGGVTKENAHPFFDCTSGVAVAHNGIIENYQELRAELVARGHLFTSETDSEVVSHLIEENISLGIEKAACAAAKRLRGSYALLAISSSEPGKVVALKHESPLLVGLGEKEFFAASDATPLLQYTRRVVFLEDGEAAVLEKDRASFFSTEDGSPLEKQERLVEWSHEDAGKAGYEHFMLKEIFEQPRALRDVLLQDERALCEFAEEIKKAERVVVVACGTARHAAVIGKHFLDRIAGKEVDVLIASEYSYFAENESPESIVLAVSQSGETADVLEGLRKAKAKGARIYSIVNTRGSSIDRLSERSLYLNCGPEIGVASTKAFMNQCAVFYLLARAMNNELARGKSEITGLSKLVAQELKEADGQIKGLAEWLATKQHAYYLGRGVNFAIALEGALKLKEISYVHAEGMPAGELKHGTLALIDAGAPVFLLNPRDYTYFESLSNGVETKARGARLVGLSNEPNAAYDEFLRLPEPSDALLYPLLSIVPLQLLAYYTAVALGHDPDKPRNLAKSVTVK
ncbi:MAG: glutamine--fructose-6-phosphate transaminase (isomerizing) [Candidatus Micrarchaeia archaeon]